MIYCADCWRGFDRDEDLVRFNTVVPRLLHAAVRHAALAEGVRLRIWVTEALEDYLAAVTARGGED